MSKITNIIGQSAEGDNFFGREKEIVNALELLEDGNSLILAAPRRVGKTSFARRMIEKVSEKGWNGYYIDLEKSPTEADFVKHFLKELKGEKWWERFSPEQLNIEIKDFSLEFKKQKQDIYHKIEKELPHNEDTLIVFDELTVFFDNALKTEDGNLNDVKCLLDWLRGLRMEKGTKIRWIFCSSISIEHFTHKHNFSKTINDFTRFKLDELQGNEPKMLVQALANSKNVAFHDELIDYMLDRLGWNLPYFIQCYFRAVVELIADGKTLSKETIDEAYKNLLNTNYFYHWTERLVYYENEKRFAKIVLNELSRTKNGRSKNNLYNLIFSELNDADKADEIFKPLLKLLETEGYIMNNNDRYSFRSPLLRDFWFNQFGK
ncbi:ATP-binding protein [Bacteroidia bacterium]|nr:ATP-binding protein [Bacteroidia bacterium]